MEPYIVILLALAILCIVLYIKAAKRSKGTFRCESCGAEFHMSIKRCIFSAHIRDIYLTDCPVCKKHRRAIYQCTKENVK